MDTTSLTVGALEHVMVALFTVTLLAQVPVLLHLGTLAGRAARRLQAA